MRDTGWQQRPSPVAGAEPEPAQGGEIRARWAWVEASVWTMRMLKALETGMGEGSWTNAFFHAHGSARLALPDGKLPRGPSISVRSNHQLESRMQEICLSGSGEGAGFNPVPISSGRDYALNLV